MTETQYARFQAHNDPTRHAELRPEVCAGALNADTNTFTRGSPNEAIDRVWGREAAMLTNNPVQQKFRNNGFRRENVAPGGPDSAVIRLAPVNAQFVRSRVLSREEWDIYHRTIGGFARTYTEQQAVGREELDASTAIKQIDFALSDNCVWSVLYTVVTLTSEDVKSKLKTLRGQFDVMFNYYDPCVHPVHHLISGPLALNTKILQYGTVSDQLASQPLMDRLMTVLGGCFDSLQEGDRTPYNVAIHEFMVDYNNRDDARVRPKPQHSDAWQSPEALLQFAIDVFGQHKPELLDRNPHLHFRPAVFNEPVPASIQTNYTEIDSASSVFATSEACSELAPYDQHAQLLATLHRRGGNGKGGGGKPVNRSQLGYHGTAAGGGDPSTRVSRQQTAPNRFAAKRQDDKRRALFDEVLQARQEQRSVFPFKRGEQPPVVQPARDPPRFQQRSKSTPPSQHISSPVAGRPSLTRLNAAVPNTMSDRHPHSSRTGAPDHQRMYFTAAQAGGSHDGSGPRQREFLPPRCYAVLKEHQKLLEKTLSDSSQLSQQHLVSVLRQMQAGTSALMVTETDTMQQDDFENGAYHGDYDDANHNEPSHGFLTSSSSISPEALHILQTLQTSGFEGSPADESDAIHSLLDQLPLSNFMIWLESVVNALALQTRAGSLNHEIKPINMTVGGVVQETITSHWDSCASFCFESSLNHCVLTSFVELVKNVVTANGGCNSDGMAWRRFHIPIDDKWIALGDACNVDLRQADVITFAMPTIVVTQFSTPVSIVAAPVAKGLLIGTNIAASFHEQDSIVLHQQPTLEYSLHNQANGIPVVALIADEIVQARKLRMISHVDLAPYTDEKAMQTLSNQWSFHDPTSVYWPFVLECYNLLIIGRIPRNIDCPIDSERGGMRFDGRQFIIERRLLKLMYLDGRASPSRMQRVAQIVNSSHAVSSSVSVIAQSSQAQKEKRAELSGSFNDSVIDGLYTRKLTSNIKTEDLWSMINPIAHEMSSGHSSMGEYPRAIPPSVTLNPVVVSPSDVCLVSQTTYSVADADSITDDSDADSITDEPSHTSTPSLWNKHLSDRHLSDTEQGTTAAFPEVTGDGAKPYTYCRTASCRRQAPGPFPPSVCGVRELHCCLHCCDTNGTRHSRQCEAYTTDNPPPPIDDSICSPGGTSATHPGYDSETVINDNDGDNVQQSSTSGGAPARRMYGGFGPEPEGGNLDDVFIDDGVPDDDEVVANMTAGLAPPPPPPPPFDDPDDVFVDDDDDVVDDDDDDVVDDDDDDVVDDDDDVVDDDDDDDVVDSTTVAPTLAVTSSLGSSVVTSPYDYDGEVFVDDGDGDDIVDPVVLAAAAAAGRSISPRTSAEWDAREAAAAAARAAAAVAPVVIPPDDDSSDASASDTTPAATSTDTTSPTVPSVIHVCDTAGCLRRPASDPASFGTIGYHICCGSCAFSNGQTHTQACQAQSLTPAEYFAWRRSTVPAPAPPSSGNSGGDGRGAPSHHDDFLPGWHNYGLGARDTSDAPTPTTMPAPTPTPTPMPTPASAPLPTPTVFNELVFTPVFPPRVDGEFCRGCNICVGRGPLPNLTLALCHCSCGQCEYGVYPGDETAQGGMCDFCCGVHIHVPQHNTYANRCNCDCDGCCRGRERLGILYDDETWIDHQTNDGEDPDSVFSTL